MSIRCIWVVSVLPESFGKVLYLRRFPTVEKKVKSSGESYANIPPEKQFSSNLLTALGLSHESKQFVDWRDRASKEMQLPVITIKIKEKELWPILVVEQLSCLLCCLPYVSSTKCKDLFNLPSIALGFSILNRILNFLGSVNTYSEEQSQRFIELDNYLTLCMPFGEPSNPEAYSDISFCNISSSLSTGKQSSWKQMPQKGKSSIFIEVNEYVKSCQSHDKISTTAVELYGNIIIKLDSPNQINELSLMLEHGNRKSLDLESLIIHPCVQTFMPDSNLPKKFWLMPISKQFSLCYYTAHITHAPITAIFKLKGTTSVELYVQLNLVENVKNSFQTFEVFIPFFHRGPILNFEFKLSQGFLHISEDRHSLKWNVGNKFASRTLDAFLTAKVTLSSGPKSVLSDPFCHGKNAYIQISFKQSNETLSGCSIDTKSITVLPHHKMKIFTDYSVQSTEYKIWNSLGDLPFPLISPLKE